MNQPDLLSWEAPATRRTDPETCAIAASNASMRASKNRLLVLQHLMEGPKTDFQLADATGIQQTSIGCRRGECKKHGLVEVMTDNNGKSVTRPSPSGSPSLVWQITAAGTAFYLNSKN